MATTSVEDELAALKAEHGVMKTILFRVVREAERVRRALKIHEQASIAAVDSCHFLADRVALLQAKLDLPTDVDDRRVH
jgi:hypothetical protein